MNISIKNLMLTGLLATNFGVLAASAPTADIAILLDTSGSMQGLIDQVRDGLWKTLNGLGILEKDGVKANVRLALFEYGSGVVPAEANFIQLLAPLTSDHTILAQKLFATKAQGSSEYSGMAIDLATDSLGWTKELGDFRSIVIAGNETLKQGPLDALEAARKANGKETLSLLAHKLTLLSLIQAEDLGVNSSVQTQDQFLKFQLLQRILL